MTPGFHWFVAWRYLMSRPRGLSPSVVAIAGAAFIASAVVALIADDVITQAADVGFLSLAAYRMMLVSGLVLGGVGLLVLLLGVVGYALRYPDRLLVPAAAVLGLMFLAGGAIAQCSSDRTTWIVAMVFLVAGAGLFVVALVRAWLQHRHGTGGTLVVALLLTAAGGAVISTAAHTVRPLPALAIAYRVDAVALPALGLLILGVAAVIAILVGFLALRQVSRAGAITAALLLAASAAYPTLAVAVLGEHESIQFEPAGVAHLAAIQWAGVALLALGAGVLGIALWRGRGQERRPSVALILVGTAVLVAGALSVALALLVLTPREALMIVSLGGPADSQPLLLVAVAALALGELTVMLALVRYLFTFFTTVSIAGVAIGSMALVIVLGVMSGFESDLRKKILGSNAHVLITKEDGPFTEYREISEQVTGVPGVVATTPYLSSEVVIAANNNYSNVVIKGVDPETVGSVTELAENAEHPRALERLWPLSDDGEILGRPADLGERPGERLPGWNGPDVDSGLDPPPPDLVVDIDDPMDLSGGALEPEHLDPPPPDLDMDMDEPMDLSGELEPGELEPDDVYAEPGDPGEDDHAPGDDERMDDGSLLGTGSAMDSLFDIDALETRPRIPPRIARLPGVLVGRELAKQIHLYVGQEVRIVSPLAQDTPAGPVPRTRYLRVADVFYSGMYEYDFKFVYVPLPMLQTFLDVGDQVTGIEIRVTDPDRTEPVLRDIRQRLSRDFRVQDWKELNRSLFAALKLEKIAMFLVLAIIILVASFSIVGNLIMVVVEKAKEIALLKTLGASNTGVLKVFVAQGFFIGVVGTSIGVLHGLIACALGLIYGLPIDPEVYYIDRLPIHIEIESVIAVAVAGVVISVVATLYPAYVGARMQPIEGLRYE